MRAEGIPVGIDWSSLSIRQGRCLPHWEQDRGVYHVVFRLADSLPIVAIERIKAERRQDAQCAARQGALNSDMLRWLKERQDARIAELLDNGHGCCLLARGSNAQNVYRCLWEFVPESYILRACAVMPNHMHVLLEPACGHGIKRIVAAIRKLTSEVVPDRPSPAAPLWQREPYDHIVRSEAAYLRAVDYIADNPGAAGLEGWPWSWKDGWPVDPFGREP